MLLQKLMVLRDIPVVVVGNPQIEDNVEDEGDIQQGVVKAKIPVPNNDLDVPVNAENPQRLDQKIEKDDQNQVGDKLLFQG